MKDPTVKKLFNVFDKIRMNEYPDPCAELEALQKAVKAVVEEPEKSNAVTEARVNSLNDIIALADYIETRASSFKDMVKTESIETIITSDEYRYLANDIRDLDGRFKAFEASLRSEIFERFDGEEK